MSTPNPKPPRFFVRRSVVFEVIDRTNNEVYDITGSNDLASFDTEEAAKEYCDQFNADENA